MMAGGRDLPARRRLRVFALDPSLDRATATVDVARLVLSVPWDRADGRNGPLPGPVGEYLEVCDVDPASGCWYEPLDLMDPAVLAEDGLEPSTADPQFHQQMVYAVAMTTIEHFEHALGRRAMWADRGDPPPEESAFVPRLRIYPHAFRGENAYYSPDKKALLFGYFPSAVSAADGFKPGGMVFCCLSHDIIAHECCHALLDGIHGYYLEETNPDSLAFHEAFADLVALFQRFTWPELLRGQIARTRGDLHRQNLLGALAQEFGRATGRYGALRDALGQVDPKTGEWQARRPDPRALENTTGCHERGAILVAAVFDAYLTIYTQRVADLLDLAAQLRGGEFRGPLPAELRDRLAGEAAKAARHVLTMIIRALDYCPPVDITFGDYLRALITADADLVADDDRGYRTAFIEAFERWGIYPRDVRSMSEGDLLWERLDDWQGSVYDALHGDAAPLADQARALGEVWTSDGNRAAIHQASHECKAVVQAALGAADDSVRRALHLRLKDEADSDIEVVAVRPAQRIGPDGQVLTDVIVELIQSRPGWQGDPRPGSPPDFVFRGGCTLIVDALKGKVRYCIFKKVDSERRYGVQRALGAEREQVPALHSGLGLRGAEPFAMSHQGVPRGEW